MSTDSAGNFGELPVHAISASQAALALFKAILGPSILFLPAAVKNAGLLSATIVTLLSGGVAIWCMLLVLDSADHLRRQGHTINGMGDIGHAAFGVLGRVAVDVSIILAQLGFCTAYCVFVGENVQAVIFESYGGKPGRRGEGAPCNLPGLLGEERLVFILILAIMPLLIPFTWIRRIKYFTWSNIVATVLVIGSTLYMLFVFVSHLAANGPKHVELFQLQGSLTYLGTAMYAFEGIGVLLPVERSMANPKALPAVVCWTVGGACVLQVVFASLAYCVFGTATQSIVTVSLGNGTLSLGGAGWAIRAVQVAWIAEVLLTFPLQMLPAARIIESTFAEESRSGWKWAKNMLRTALVALCIGVATLGYSSVDSMVSIIGAIGCVPLAIVYPALFHLKVNFSCCGGNQQALLPQDPSQCAGNRGKPKGSLFTDLSIVTLGALGVSISLTVAVGAWAHSSFHFQACVL